MDYEPLPAVVDMERALEAGAVLVHEDIGDQRAVQGRVQARRLDGRSRAATGCCARRSAARAWPACRSSDAAACAHWDVGRETLTEWSSTQIPHLLRTSLAELLGLPETRVRVVAPDVGGGFGTKAHVYPEELVVAALSMKLGRPVKWIQDRREELDDRASTRATTCTRSRWRSTGDGVIQGVKLRLLTNAGAFASFPFGCTLEPTGGARMMVGPYRIQNYAYEAYAIATNTCPSGAYRGVAQPSAFFTIEGMMDRIGRALGIDPAEVRFRNVIREFPYVNAVGVRYDSGSYGPSLRRALDLIGYDEYRRRQTPSRLENGKYRGIGICCMTEITRHRRSAGFGAARGQPRSRASTAR